MSVTPETGCTCKRCNVTCHVPLAAASASLHEVLLNKEVFPGCLHRDKSLHIAVCRGVKTDACGDTPVNQQVCQNGRKEATRAEKPTRNPRKICNAPDDKET